MYRSKIAFWTPLCHLTLSWGWPLAVLYWLTLDSMGYMYLSETVCAYFHSAWCGELRKFTDVATNCKKTPLNLWSIEREFATSVPISGNSNLGHIMHSFGAIVTYWLKSRLWDIPVSHLMPSLGMTPCEYVDEPYIIKCATHQWRWHHPTFICSDILQHASLRRKQH